MRIIESLAAILLVLTAAAPSLAKNVTETRDVADFNKVSLDGLGDLDITIGEGFAVTVSASDDIIGHIITRVRGSRLVIDFDDFETSVFNISDLDIEIKITMPALEGLDIDGLADVTVKDLDADKFTLNIDGKVDVDLVGTCVTAEIEINGWGDLDARDFKCENVIIEFDGVGEAEVYASKSIDASADGMADIEVYGNPEKVTTDEDGFADIDIRD